MLYLCWICFQRRINLISQSTSVFEERQGLHRLNSFSGGVRFGYKVGQIGPKWDKSVTFSDHISVHFGARQQSDMKKSRMCPFWGQSDTLDLETDGNLTPNPNVFLLYSGVRFVNNWVRLVPNRTTQGF